MIATPDGLGIPEQQKGALVKLLRFSSKEWTLLLDVLKEMRPSLFGRSFIAAWTKKAHVPESGARELFGVLAGLYASMDIARDSPQVFASKACEAIRASVDLASQTKEVDWDGFEAHLARALSFDETLGVSAKASELRAEYGKVFCSARILTDLRPVFGTDVDKGPLAAVVVHNAKITFHENGEETTKDFYVALDSEDIAELKKMLDRASRKEASLVATARKGGTNVLEH